MHTRVLNTITVGMMNGPKLPRYFRQDPEKPKHFCTVLEIYSWGNQTIHQRTFGTLIDREILTTINKNYTAQAAGSRKSRAS